jgi:hypothetical protein
MTWDGKERRAKKRYGVKGAVVRYKGSSPIAFLSASSPRYLILNLSETGLEFMTKEPIEEGAKLSFSLEAPRVHGTIRGRGEVIWVKPSKNQEAFRVGAAIRLSGRSLTLARAILENAVIDSVEISTRVYLKEIERL